MADVYNEAVLVSGTKRITELYQLNKLTGSEEILIDNGGDDTYKVTVDTLLGYIANRINQGTIPPSVYESTNIIVIEKGENIPIPSRVEGNFYLRVCDVKEAHVSAGLNKNIRVSPNMALKLINE